MGKQTPKKSQICTDSPNFATSFKEHMMKGNDKGARHSGLHSVNELMATSDSYKMANKETDGRNPKVYAADVTLKGKTSAKRSSFFPDSMSYDEVKAKVIAAWRDYKTFFREDTIYSQLTKKYGLAWVGLADLGGQRIWIGSTRSGTSAKPIETAFPAVNNKFIKGSAE